MRGILTVTLAAGLVSVAAAGTVVAESPVSRFSETIPDIELCDFPVTLHSEVQEVITRSGVQHWSGKEQYVNPATGTAYDATWAESWRMKRDGTIQGAGSLWKLTVPGRGVVLVDAGYRLYDGPPDYEFLAGHGPSFDDTMLEEFCELMES